MKKFYRQLASDITVAFIVFLLSMWIHPGPLKEEIRVFGTPALCFYIFHILVSLLLRKYERGTRYPTGELITRYNLSWVITIVAALLALILFQIHHISRQVLFTNLFGLLSGEYLLILLVTLFRESVPLRDPEEIVSARVTDPAGLRLLLLP